MMGIEHAYDKEMIIDYLDQCLSIFLVGGTLLSQKTFICLNWKQKLR